VLSPGAQGIGGEATSSGLFVWAWCAPGSPHVHALISVVCEGGDRMTTSLSAEHRHQISPVSSRWVTRASDPASYRADRGAQLMLRLSMPPRV